jgi:predicted O-methyltransferase YrrM
MSDPAQGSVEWTEHDLLALAVLGPLLQTGGYLPWSSGAMRASGLVTICNEIVLSERRRIVELGAGASTILLARLLRQEGAGATLLAVEHDGQWARWVSDRLEREGLADVARVVVAPLAPHPKALDGLHWYDQDPLDDALTGDPADLLIVDGPPAFVADAALARYPALPALARFLTPDAVVVLDDIVRPGEAGILERWDAETPWRFERRTLEAIGVGRIP